MPTISKSKAKKLKPREPIKFYHAVTDDTAVPCASLDGVFKVISEGKIRPVNPEKIEKWTSEDVDPETKNRFREAFSIKPLNLKK